MGNSFVLRDRQGMQAGYLTQGWQTAYCRVKGMVGKAEAVLFLENGACCRYAIENAAEEQVWKTQDSPAEGVVILCDGGIWALSGEAAERRYAAMQRSEQKKEKRENASAGPAAPLGDEAHEPATEQADERKDEEAWLPQRRWPRPPCWQEAIYEKGRWTQGDA